MSEYLLALTQPDRLPALLRAATDYGELSLPAVARAVGFRERTAQPYAELLVEAGLLQRRSLSVGRRTEPVYVVTEDAFQVITLAGQDDRATLFVIAYRLPIFRRFADLRLLYSLLAVFLHFPNKREWVYEQLLTIPALGAIADPFLVACTDERGRISDDRFAAALSDNWDAALCAHGLPATERPFALEDRFRRWEVALDVPRSDYLIIAEAWLDLWQMTAGRPVYISAVQVPAPNLTADADPQLDVFLCLLIASTQRGEGMYVSLPHAARHLQIKETELAVLIEHWQALGVPVLASDGATILLRPVRLGSLPDALARWEDAQQLGLLDRGHPQLDVAAETFSTASSVAAPLQLTPIRRSFLLDLRARVGGESTAVPYPIIQPPDLADLTAADRGNDNGASHDAPCAFVYGMPPRDQVQRRGFERADYADSRHWLTQHLPYVLLLLLLSEHAWDRESEARCWLRVGRGNVLLYDSQGQEALAKQVLPAMLRRLGYHPLPGADLHLAFQLGQKLGFWRNTGQLYRRYGDALSRTSADWWDDNAALRDQLAGLAAQMLRGSDHD